MGSQPYIAARITPEMKTLVRTLADREQITESALVKQLLEVVLRTAALAGAPKVATLDEVNRDARVYVRLSKEDRLLLHNRAMARGMASATYVSALVRAHLRAVTPLPREELLALKRSVAELSAIGRNLNQIARAANQGGKVPAQGREDVRAMLKVAEGLRDHFKALLKANERSWAQGHADEPN